MIALLSRGINHPESFNAIEKEDCDWLEQNGRRCSCLFYDGQSKKAKMQVRSAMLQQQMRKTESGLPGYTSRWARSRLKEGQFIKRCLPKLIFDTSLATREGAVWIRWDSKKTQNVIQRKSKSRITTRECGRKATFRGPKRTPLSVERAAWFLSRTERAVCQTASLFVIRAIWFFSRTERANCQ